MIPFTQYLRPHGSRTPVQVQMPAEVERIAHALIEAGAHFEIEALRDGYISLECLCGRYEDSGDPVVLAHELCANGPPVLEAVAKLVRDAYTFKFGGVPS